MTAGRQTGAWELGWRYSSIDLENNPIRGGELRTRTLALSWYANKSLRLSANYIRISGTAADPVEWEPDGNIVQLRVQWVIK